MQHDFSDLLEQRKLNTEGIDSLLWVKEDDGAWEGPLNDWISSHKEKILRHCKSFDTVIQAGGNQGMYPLFLSKIFKKVITAEPDFLNFHCLVNNCTSENIIKLNCAFTDENKMLSIVRPTMKNRGMFQTIDGDSILGIKIDDLKIDNISLIWLDIESYEIFALKGAKETILKHRPVIITENGNFEIESFIKSLHPSYQKVDQSVSDSIYVYQE